MKLFIQIPCYNEETSLAQTVAGIPKEIDGIDSIDIVIINDGSTDKTVEVAKELGCLIVNIPYNLGLANAFKAGIEFCLEHGADIIVNMDGDNQYPGWQIPNLIKPLKDNMQSMIIGSRDFNAREDFSKTKRLLQRIGSYFIYRLSGIKISDATSGFRAFDHKAALKLIVISNFTYTLDTILMCKQSGINIIEVPIESNTKVRPSRLFKSNISYINKSAINIFMLFLMERPLQLILPFSVVFFSFFLYSYIPKFYYFTFINNTARYEINGIELINLLISGILFVIGLLFNIQSRIYKLIREDYYLTKKIRYSSKRDNDCK